MGMADANGRFASHVRGLMQRQRPPMTQNALAVRLLHQLGEPVGLTRVRSVESLVAKWLSGSTSPSMRYVVALRSVFNATDVELGLVEPEPLPVQPEPFEAADERSRLASRYARASALGRDDVEQLRQQLNDLRDEDRGGAAGFAFDDLGASLAKLQELASYSLRPAIHREVLPLLADAAGIRGWQLLNAGQLVAADATFRLGEQAAHEGDDAAAYAFLRTEHAYVLADAGRVEDARLLVESTYEAASGKVPRVLEAWLHAATAEVKAAVGDPEGCRRSLDLARDALADADGDPSVPYVVLGEEHLERWRGSSLARLGDGGGIEQLERARQRLDPSFVRARSGVLTDLVTALLAAGEVGEALRLFPDAHGVARLAGSERQLARLARLHARLFASDTAAS